MLMQGTSAVAFDFDFVCNLLQGLFRIAALVAAAPCLFETGCFRTATVPLYARVVLKCFDVTFAPIAQGTSKAVSCSATSRLWLLFYTCVEAAS